MPTFQQRTTLRQAIGSFMVRRQSAFWLWKISLFARSYWGERWAHLWLGPIYVLWCWPWQWHDVDVEESTVIRRAERKGER